jgi:hypothetical protein
VVSTWRHVRGSRRGGGGGRGTGVRLPGPFACDEKRNDEPWAHTHGSF